jgi:hypothetical protein
MTLRLAMPLLIQQNLLRRAAQLGILGSQDKLVGFVLFPFFFCEKKLDRLQLGKENKYYERSGMKPASQADLEEPTRGVSTWGRRHSFPLPPGPGDGRQVGSIFPSRSLPYPQTAPFGGWCAADTVKAKWE